MKVLLGVGGRVCLGGEVLSEGSRVACSFKRMNDAKSIWTVLLYKRQNVVTTFQDTLTYACLPNVKVACMIWGDKQLPEEQMDNQCNVSGVPL